MKLLYGGEDACFSSFRAKDGKTPILNPESPRDASWGERYFHMPDPDGHELSFARPIGWAFFVAFSLE